MPHFVHHRKRCWGLRSGPAVHWFDFVLSVGFHAGSCCFVVGCWLFCKSLGSSSVVGNKAGIETGDTLFVVGASVYLVITAIELVEAHVSKASITEMMQRYLFFLGSVIFELGTIAHSKRMVEAMLRTGDFNWEGTVSGTLLFITGSLVFTIGSFINALELDAPHSATFSRWEVSVCSLYEAGGLVFIMGSVSYLGPDVQECGMWQVELGNVCYFVGSILYLTGDIVSLAILYLLRLVAKAHKQEDGAYELDIEEMPCICEQDSDDSEDSMTQMTQR